jgi:hypothetical protein
LWVRVPPPELEKAAQRAVFVVLAAVSTGVKVKRLTIEYLWLGGLAAEASSR